MGDFVKVATTSQLQPGSMLGAKAGSLDVLVVNVGGKFYAMGGICTHRGGILSNGKLEGKVVTCPRHGSQFDVTTGKNLAGPKILGIRGTTGDEPAYEVKVEGENVFVRTP